MKRARTRISTGFFASVCARTFALVLSKARTIFIGSIGLLDGNLCQYGKQKSGRLPTQNFATSTFGNAGQENAICRSVVPAHLQTRGQSAGDVTVPPPPDCRYGATRRAPRRCGPPCKRVGSNCRHLSPHCYNPRSRALGMTLCTPHATIDIHADRAQGFLLGALQHRAAIHGLSGVDASLVRLRAHPADRRSVGKTLGAQHAINQRIFPIARTLP
jgi:hypothetical protein